AISCRLREQRLLLLFLQEVSPVHELLSEISIEPIKKLPRPAQARGAIVINHRAHQAQSSSARWLRNYVRPLRELDRTITRITRKQLIAPGAAERNRNAGPSRFRDQIHQVERGIAKGLIKVIDQLEHFHRLRDVHRNLVMLSREPFGGDASLFLFVVELDILALEDDGECLYRLARSLGHQSREDGRIN